MKSAAKKAQKAPTPMAERHTAVARKLARTSPNFGTIAEQPVAPNGYVVHECKADVGPRIDVSIEVSVDRRVLACIAGDDVILQARDRGRVVRQLRVPLSEMSDEKVIEMREDGDCWLNIRTESAAQIQGNVPVRDLDTLIAGLTAAVAAGRAAGVLPKPIVLA